MLNERYGIKAEQLVIVVAVEKPDKNGSEAQVFVRDPKDYYPLLAQKLLEFRAIQENNKKESSVMSFFS